jgi:hypothetical protein
LDSTSRKTGAHAAGHSTSDLRGAILAVKLTNKTAQPDQDSVDDAFVYGADLDSAIGQPFAIAALDSPQQWSDLRVINVLVAAEAVRRSGMHERWLPALTALTGTPWPDRVFAAARLFVSHRWSTINLVAAELMFARYASVSHF